MSLHKDTIQVIAQTLGIQKLKDEIAQSLASDVEYRVRGIIQDAAKFMKHSKRKILTTDDINHALALKNVEPLYGYKSGGSGIDRSKTLGFHRVSQQYKDLYFLEDIELDIKDCLETPLPKLPVGPSVSAHWLAIQGVQPRIPQNPVQVIPLKAKEKKEVKEEEKDAQKKRTEGVVVDSTQENVEVKPLVKHVLSAELQMYYEKVIEAVKGGKFTTLRATFESLASDAGLHQLVPYFTQFVAHEVTNNLTKLNYLYNLMEMVRSLLINPHLHVELYLHQLMPPILTCLVGKTLMEDPKQNHWALRDFAANLIGYICRKYGSSYHSLQPRITKTLLNALLDPTKPRSTHYGAIVGISALGFHTSQLLLLEPPKHSNLKIYIQFLSHQLTSKDPIERHEAMMCYGALMDVASTFFISLSRYFGHRAITPKGYQTNIKEVQSNIVEVEEEDEMDITNEEPETPTKKENVENLSRILFERAHAAHVPEDVVYRYNELYDIFGESILPFIFYDIVPGCENVLRDVFI